MPYIILVLVVIGIAMKIILNYQYNKTVEFTNNQFHYLQGHTNFAPVRPSFRNIASIITLLFALFIMMLCIGTFYGIFFVN